MFETLSKAPGDKILALMGEYAADPRPAKIDLGVGVYKDEAGYGVGAISRDGKWIGLDKANTTADTDTYLYNVETKALKHVTPHTGVSTNSAATFDPDSKWLYLLSNA